MRQIKGMSEKQQLKTLTMVELATLIIQHIKQDKKVANYKVYLSVDPEGNGYGTIDEKYSLQFGEADKIVSLMPFNEGLTDEDIAPKEMAAIDAEMRHDSQVEARAS